MSMQFVEGNLLFKFGDRWEIFGWDRHPAYLKGMKKSHKGKAVDFIGIYDRKEPFLIEVKDYRIHRRASDKEPLEREFERKVRCTMAALVGTRCRGQPEECLKAFNALISARKPNVVFWLEEARPQGTPQAARRLLEASAGALTDQITREMPWLNANTIVTGIIHDYQLVVPDVEVQSLQPERKEKVESIINKLKERNIKMPLKVEWRIRDCLDLAELDHALRRADDVHTAWKLFDRRT